MERLGFGLHVQKIVSTLMKQDFKLYPEQTLSFKTLYLSVLPFQIV